MGNWSIYVSPGEERLLKKKIEEVAGKRRWSFSQAVAAILREHLIDEKKKRTDETEWELMATESFLEGYSEKDSIYDSL